jgi:hypothetical protein
MAAPTVKLGDKETRGLSALGGVAKRSATGTIRRCLAPQRRGAGVGGEVVIFVLSAVGAVVGRTEVRGRPPDAQALRALLVGANVAAGRLATGPVEPAPPLGAAESAVLNEAGLVDGSEEVDPLERAQIELALLVRESLSIEEAARALGVSAGRLRQRLAPSVRTLYGIKLGGRAWRLPRFQFRKGRLVRNIAQVLPSIDPMRIRFRFTWFASPHQDLVVGDDEKRVTPIAARSGLDPSVVPSSPPKSDRSMAVSGAARRARAAPRRASRRNGCGACFGAESIQRRGTDSVLRPHQRAVRSSG